MKVGLVADPTCDLPRDFLDEMGVFVLPIAIRIGDRELLDARDPGETLAFHTNHLAAKGTLAESRAPSVEDVRRFFLDRVVTGCDFALCLTVSSTRSPVFANVTKAGLGILTEYKATRQAAKMEGPFAVRVLDSRNMFAGQGALTAEAAALIAQGFSAAAVRERIEELAYSVHSYLVPKDLYYIRARAKKKGDRSVGPLRYLLGTAMNIRPVLACTDGETEAVQTERGFEAAVRRLFDFARARIGDGLQGRFLCVSYGGPPERLGELPGFDELVSAAEAGGIRVLTSVMSMTAGVNVGDGAVSVGFLAAPRAFD